MKKIIALLLAVLVLATLSVTVFAEDYTTEGDKSLSITYTVDPGYFVTIPQNVTIDNSAVTLSVTDVIVEKGQYVSISLDAENSFIVSTDEGAELEYTVTANGETVSAGEEIVVINPFIASAGSADVTFAVDQSKIKYSGVYTGTAVFTVAVKNLPLITFTVGEQTCYAEEGMTWEDWLGSIYNDDGYEIIVEDTFELISKGELGTVCDDFGWPIAKSETILDKAEYKLNPLNQ